MCTFYIPSTMQRFKLISATFFMQLWLFDCCKTKRQQQHVSVSSTSQLVAPQKQSKIEQQTGLLLATLRYILQSIYVLLYVIPRDSNGFKEDFNLFCKYFAPFFHYANKLYKSKDAISYYIFYNEQLEMVVHFLTHEIVLPGKKI